MRKIFPQIVLAVVTFIGLSLATADEFDSDGVRIHYTVSGQGEPVILIHGLYSNAKMNWDMPSTTAELAKHYQVIALDNRGHGQSEKPEAEGQYGVKMVEDVVRLMDHLHIAKAHVAGYSMGGMIMMKLLTLHPDRVISAVLGGMGWLQTDTPLQRFWETIRGRDNQKVPVVCPHGFAQLAVTEGGSESRPRARHHHRGRPRSLPADVCRAAAPDSSRLAGACHRGRRPLGVRHETRFQSATRRRD